MNSTLVAASSIMIQSMITHKLLNMIIIIITNIIASIIISFMLATFSLNSISFVK